MFDIKIGTLIPAEKTAAMIPQLNPKGFESYELDFNSWDCLLYTSDAADD